MITNRFWTVIAIAVFVTGCESQGGTRQPTPTVGQREAMEQQIRQRQAEERDKQTRIQEEQAALQRLIQSRKARGSQLNDAEQPQVIPLADAPMLETLPADQAQLIKDADSSAPKRSIYYDYDAYSVGEQYEPLLKSHANLLLEHSKLQVRIEGNCDDRGSREYNLALGQRRADSVKRALSLLGVPQDQIGAVSYGSEKPKAPGHKEPDWAENRRSDFIYM